MSKRKQSLSVEDRTAVDLVLDHASATSVVTRLSGHAPPDRVGAVTRLLGLLNELPAIDPPTDLVARTMERIDRVVAAHAATQSNLDIHPSAGLH